jgi:diaminopimelate epimerase
MARTAMARPELGAMDGMAYTARESSSMTPLAAHSALKMNGLGNEIVILDLRASTHVVTPAEARAIGRAPGLHFDQLMVLHAPRTPGVEAFVLIYNIDGSEAGACGNGTRCVAWLLTRESDASHVAVETRAGILACQRLGPLTYAVDMGRPGLGWRDIPLAREVADTTHAPLDTGFLGADMPGEFTGVSMGNPHAVFFVDDVEAHDLARTGPILEINPMFPEKANISLAAVASPSALTLKVWERGAGLTRACGSGACAAAVAAHRRGLTGRKVSVTLPGGDLLIDWRDTGSVTMTGPVEFEREVVLRPEHFEAAA